MPGQPRSMCGTTWRPGSCAARSARRRGTPPAAGYAGPATFYVWHDLAAGQLRCSVSSAPRDALPLGAEYQVTGDLHAIAQEFLLDRAPGAIAWGSLDPVPYPESEEIAVDSVAVWACDLCLPARSSGRQ
jgi:hypothetical protein